jgi:hypothetical protein
MKKKLLALFLYASSMAFVESAVVVYLRALLFPSRFSTSLRNIPSLIYYVELIREASTIIMLLTVAYLAFRDWKNKALTFLWIFAIWDICYYIFLRLAIAWPTSLGDTDILFLIPIPWIAPVWFPIAISTIVLAVTSYLFYLDLNKPND